MAKDEERAEQGFDQEKWQKLHELTSKLAVWQDQAVQLTCPSCRASLARNDIVSVRCTRCQKIFNCQILVESCGLLLDD